MAKIKGTVKWFNAKKGFGFITAEDGTDHFVHRSGIVEGRNYPGFEDGDQVEFELVEGRKGKDPQASAVVLTKKVEEIEKAENPE